MILETHDLLREPGRVSVDKTKLAAVLEELNRVKELAQQRFDALVKVRLERDEARKELVRERARHRMVLDDLEHGRPPREEV